jgi:hypothetical protein
MLLISTVGYSTDGPNTPLALSFHTTINFKTQATTHHHISLAINKEMASLRVPFADLIHSCVGFVSLYVCFLTLLCSPSLLFLFFIPPTKTPHHEREAKTPPCQSKAGLGADESTQGVREGEGSWYAASAGEARTIPWRWRRR